MRRGAKPTSVTLPCLAFFLVLVAASPVGAQAAEAPRRWEVRAEQRYRRAGDLGNEMGSLAWHESIIGVHGGAFVPGPGLVRGGVGYAYTRFSLGSPLRMGGTESKTLGDVAEIRLSVQVFTPWSRTWSSQLFGVLSSAFESGAAPDDAVSGAVALGATRRFSGRLSAGFGALLLHQLDSRAVTVVPIALVDWQITERLALRSRQGVTLTYVLDARQRLSVAGVVSFFDRKQFRLDDSGAASGGTVEIGGYAVGGRVTWRPAPGLTLEGGVEAPLGQSLRVRDRSGRMVFDTDMNDGLQLSVSLRYRF